MSQENLPRDFKGIWIPREIWVNEELSPIEKLIFAEIDSLDCPERGCTASNEYLQKFFRLPERTLRHHLARLKSLKLIFEESFDGRIRVLRSSLKTYQAIFDTAGGQPIAGLAGNPLPASPIGERIEKENKVENKEEKVVLSQPPASPSKIKKKTTDGKEIEITKDDIYFMATKLKKDWSTTEIEETWRILADYDGAVNDCFRFIEGTIEIRRKQANFQKIKESKPNKKGKEPCLMQRDPNLKPTKQLDRDSLMHLFQTHGFQLPN